MAAWKGVTPSGQMMPPGANGWAEDIKAPALDVNRAKALLAEAGYPNGFETTLWSAYNNSTSQKAIQFVQQQLAQVGVKVQVQALEAGERVAKVESAPDPAKAPVRMYYIGWSSSTGEANWAITPLLAGASAPPKLVNTAYYKNDTVDGASGADEIDGDAGDDSLQGGGGKDDLDGGKGADLLKGGTGDDVLDGGRGSDVLNGGGGDDLFVFAGGRAGDDVVNGEDGDDTILGHDGENLLVGGLGVDTITGGSEADTIVGDEFNVLGGPTGGIVAGRQTPTRVATEK